MAPEYAVLGHLSVKLDVYSFGVLVLEVVTGRRNTDTCSESELEEHAGTLLSYVSLPDLLLYERRATRETIRDENGRGWSEKHSNHFHYCIFLCENGNGNAGWKMKSELRDFGNDIIRSGTYR